MNPIKPYSTLLLLFLLVFSVSCKKSDNKIETEFLTNAITQANITNNYHWIVVLPGLGCHGCIQVAEAFMKSHINDPDILFILTKVSSLKILQQKIGINIAEHSNVIVDRKDMFKVPTKNSIYPCIIAMEDGQIATHEFQSPQNGGAFGKFNANGVKK